MRKINICGIPHKIVYKDIIDEILLFSNNI